MGGASALAIEPEVQWQSRPRGNAEHVGKIYQPALPRPTKSARGGPTGDPSRPLPGASDDSATDEISDAPNQQITHWKGKQAWIETEFGPRLVADLSVANRLRAHQKAKDKPAEDPTNGFANPDKLVGHDLVAWCRCWDLSKAEVSFLLRVSIEQIDTWLAAPDSFLPYRVSRKLYSVRTESKRMSLFREAMKHDLKWTGKRPTREMIHMVIGSIGGVQGRRYMREAYCHGLDIRELEFYRYRVGWANKPVGALVVHHPTRLFAKWDAFDDFRENRSRAEASLAAKLARWAREETGTAAGRTKPIRSFEVEHHLAGGGKSNEATRFKGGSRHPKVKAAGTKRKAVVEDRAIRAKWRRKPKSNATTEV